ncbi:MAG TPA: PLP-dependent aminotransferase family protein [Clostridia bacterium]|nr:PLP-dependent aminotransferase family protein [Clostridia bacterium]
MLPLIMELDRSSSTPLYMQLYQEFKEAVVSGRLEPGLRVPSVRQLSADFHISKTTVETAYQQLVAEGYLSSRSKVGFFVNAIDDSISREEDPLGSRDLSEADWAWVNGDYHRVCYDFRNDYIDQGSFDFSLWRRYLNKTLTGDTERFLTYGSPQGEYELRKEIAAYVGRSRGVLCTPAQVVVGAGVQILLSILCGLLAPFGRNIGFEDPGFQQARHIFRDQDFQIEPIGLEEDGIDLKDLSHSKTRVVYVSPSNQFPMGSVMPIAKRSRLLKWAHDRDGLIIEDDYDSELRYFGRPIPSLQGLDGGCRVVYLGSFSKILLPAIRISYMVLPPNLVEDYRRKKARYNQTSSQIEQIALALFMKEGLLEKHIRKVRKIYARKNQMLIDTIEGLMKDQVRVIGRETGLHVLLELKSSFTPEEIVLQAEKVGVKVIPISNYLFRQADGRHPLVLLSYGGIRLEHIPPAVDLLKQVWFHS